MVPIFGTGNPDIQCAMREDGKWFSRTRRVRHNGFKHWTRWAVMIDQHRPASAWYNPRAGKARLPKD